MIFGRFYRRLQRSARASCVRSSNSTGHSIYDAFIEKGDDCCGTGNLRFELDVQPAQEAFRVSFSRMASEQDAGAVSD